MNKAIAILILTVFLFVAQSQVFAESRAEFLKGIGGNFTLTDQNNQTTSLSKFKGKIVLLFFGYTFCPDICPTALNEAKIIKGMLGKHQDQLKVVFVTIDPERDKPEILKKYLVNFDPDFVGLTGTLPQVQKVASLYKAGFKKSDTGSAAGYLVDHTSYLYQVNKKGQLVNLFSRNTNRNLIVKSILDSL